MWLSWLLKHIITPDNLVMMIFPVTEPVTVAPGVQDRSTAPVLPTITTL